ncbi:MAG: hypothetical protein ACRD2R_04420, partial [Terriglobales bacterium]
MANHRDELDEINARLAALTGRIYRLEQAAGLMPPAPEQPPLPAVPPPQLPPSPAARSAAGVAPVQA